MKKIVVLGAGGFIGSHLVRKLKSMGNYIIGIDVKLPEFSQTKADEFFQIDATNFQQLDKAIQSNIDEIYQLAADMGGAGYIFTGENDLNVMLNSATINLNVARIIKEKNIPMVFFSSSACIYPEHNQMDADNPNCEESSAYPANPDSEYGWEKLFSERLYAALARDNGTKVRIARYHNVFGPEGTWKGGKEKAPAAICRKVLTGKNEIEIWGDGEQTRSFLYIDDCIKATLDFCNNAVQFEGPINIGSEEMVSINTLVDYACEVDGKKLKKVHIPGPLGVRGRNSHNNLYKQKVNITDYARPLKEGVSLTYAWIKSQLNNS
jgi:nucleoside-diphosphate-sugar epimerase